MTVLEDWPFPQRDPAMFDGALIGAPAYDTKNLMPFISKLATLVTQTLTNPNQP